MCSDNGIGMSVVKGFTELMGGKLSVESKEGDGSTFTVDIPFSTASEKQQKMASHPVIDGMGCRNERLYTKACKHKRYQGSL